MNEGSMSLQGETWNVDRRRPEANGRRRGGAERLVVRDFLDDHHGDNSSRAASLEGFLFLLSFVLPPSRGLGLVLLRVE